MLSYRHGYHAGNHADVLKHSVISRVIAYLQEKPKALDIIDTHAGAGIYDLNNGFSQKNKEHESGVFRFWDQKAFAPTLFNAYLSILEELNPKGMMTRYPGSPHLALSALRETDHLWLSELHRNESNSLAQSIEKDCREFKARRVTLKNEDGCKTLLKKLPPRSRRGVIMIDPSYEMKTDYLMMPDLIKQAIKKFSSGVVVLWYPVVSRSLTERMLKELTTDLSADWLRVELSVSPDSSKPGMTGSGLFVVNPPWILSNELELALPWLHDVLGAKGRYILQNGTQDSKK